MGIELTEVLRPASSNHGILPLEEEAFHKEIIRTAQSNYYKTLNAQPVHVNVYFSNARGKKIDRNVLASKLLEFVQANFHRANPAAVFGRKTTSLVFESTIPDEPVLPDGLDSVLIVSESLPRDWWNGEVGGFTVSEIRTQVEAQIAAKDLHVETYRSNLPEGSELWLLLYTSPTVAQSMPIPHGATDWHIPFRFDRVIWFTSLESQFIEIARELLTEVP